jgi:hypothetical protein
VRLRGQIEAVCCAIKCTLQVGHSVPACTDQTRVRRTRIGRQELAFGSRGARRLSDYQVLLSLTWFDDAEAEPMPEMLEPFDWAECKAFFEREARALVLPP